MLGFYSAAGLWLFAPALRDFGQTVFATPGGLQADSYLVTWILSWVSHALASAPQHVFDANIHHPAPSALAGSEHLFGHLPLFAPVYALTGNPVAAIQFTRLASLTLCGAAMYALLRHWGAGGAAALIGGFVYAYCPARYFTIHALQLVAMQYLPLVLLFIDRVLDRGRVRDAAALAVAACLQLMCSFYLAYICAIAVAVYLPVVLWRRRQPRRRRAAVAIALAAALLAFAASAIPYARLAMRGEFPEHPIEMLAGFSASPWASYATRPAVDRFGPLGQAYVGVLPASLAVAALLSLWRAGPWRRPIAAAAAIGVVMYVFSLGPYLSIGDWRLPLPYRIAAALVPGFGAMRVPLRFTFGVAFAVAALAGLGAHCVVRARGRSIRALAAAVVIGLTAVDYGHLNYRAQVRPMPGPGRVPPLYEHLARLPAGPVLHLPTAIDGEDDFAALDREARNVYLSAFHWQRLLNGYTGYPPPLAATVKRLARALPDARALEILQRATGLRYVAVHGDALDAGAAARLRQVGGLVRLAAYGNDELYEVARPWAADLLPALVAGLPSEQTLLGTPVRPLFAAGRAAVLGVEAGFRAPERLLPGWRLRLPVVVENRGGAVWPILAAPSRHVVAVAYRWLEDGVEAEAGSVALPYDMAAGDTVRTAIFVPVPRRAATYQLQLGIAQDGVWFGAPLILGPLVVGG